jgi:beta-glucosidase
VATVNNTAAMIRAQNDLYMVVNNNGAEINAGDDNTLSALEEGTLTLGELQRCAHNILMFMLHTQVVKRGDKPKVNVPTIAADRTLFIEDAIKIAPESRLRFSDTLAIYIEDGCVYDLLVSVNSAAMPLAQTATNLLLNGKFVATVQTRGTLGQRVTQKLCRVLLEPGYYRVETEVINPGLNIDWLEFRNMGSSGSR